LKSSNQITAHHGGWRTQFRFAVSVFWSGVCVIKRQFYLPVLIGSLVVGVPLWFLFLRDCIRNRKGR
jgi:hypothetical protein